MVLVCVIGCRVIVGWGMMDMLVVKVVVVDMSCFGLLGVVYVSVY